MENTQSDDGPSNGNPTASDQKDLPDISQTETKYLLEPIPEEITAFPAVKTLRKRQCIRRHESAFVMIKEDLVPKTFAEVKALPDSEKWMGPLRKELENIEKRETWVIESLPENKNALDSKVVFDLKREADRSLEKYKARLVIKGCQEGQVKETYAPVVEFTSVCLTLVCLPKGALVHYLDVKCAFLNGLIEDGEEIYVNTPVGVDLGLQPGQALRLRKALYGLNNAMKLWESILHRAMEHTGFKQQRSDKFFCVCTRSSTFLWVLVYADDTLLMSESKNEVERVVDDLKCHFHLTNNGRVKSFLGVEFLWTTDGVILRQKEFIESIIDLF